MLSLIIYLTNYFFFSVLTGVPRWEWLDPLREALRRWCPQIFGAPRAPRVHVGRVQLDRRGLRYRVPHMGSNSSSEDINVFIIIFCLISLTLLLISTNSNFWEKYFSSLELFYHFIMGSVV